MKKELKFNTFVIIGKAHHITSIIEDLKEIGYDISTEIKTGISTFGFNSIEKLEEKSLLTLWVDSKSSNILCPYVNTPHIRTFNLPNQYKEALDFLQNQYNDVKEYFKKEEFKEGDWIYYCDSTEEGVFKFRKKSKTNICTKYHYLELYRKRLQDNSIISHSSLYDYISNDSWEKTFRLATKEEIISLLILVAKVKGFIPGVKVKRPSNYSCPEIISTLEEGFIPHYDKEGDSLVMGGVTVYYKGEWGEIIKEEKLIIQGYPIQVLVELSKPDIIKFGCVEVNWKDLDSILVYINSINNSSQTTRKIESINLSNNITVTVEEIEKIVNYLHDNNK